MKQDTTCPAPAARPPRRGLLRPAALAALASLAALTALAIPAPAAEVSAQALEAELRPKAEAAVRDGKLPEFRAEVMGRLAKALVQPEALKNHAAELEALEHYRNVGIVFDFKADEETRKFLVWLVGQREFCSRFCHALDAVDRPGAAVGVLRKLKAVKGVDEARYLQNYELAIAFSIIWDDFRWLHWSNLPVEEGRMEEVYEYYLTRGAALPGRPLSLPHEILRYVVDHPLTKEEREFALANYGNRAPATLGSIFFDIAWTDKAGSLAHGSDKSIVYTLLNIKKYNGVCMEQAYYASCVAKCLGVPATYCCGTGARGGHAWVGILTANGWDFAAGRYAYDHYWTGQVFDPTCRGRMISDGEVCMTAGMLSLSKARLESADARRRMALDVWTGALSGAPVTRDERGVQKPANLDAAGKKLVYELLFSSVQLNPYSRRSWELAGVAAAAGTFSMNELQTFSDHLFRSVGGVSPDFVCHTVQRFLAAVTDKKDRDRLYETCFNYFRNRPDLAAELKVAQGRMWEAEGNSGEAIRAYIEAVAFFPRDGHVTQQAAAALDAALAKGEPKKAVETLKTVWNSMHAALSAGRAEEREGMRLVGENLIKYMKLADQKDDLARFEPVFRQAFPQAAKKE